MTRLRPQAETKKLSTVENIVAITLGLALGAALVLAFFIFFGWVFAFAWNGFLVPVFQMTQISWWQGSVAMVGIWAVLRMISFSVGK